MFPIPVIITVSNCLSAVIGETVMDDRGFGTAMVIDQLRSQGWPFVAMSRTRATSRVKTHQTVILRDKKLFQK